MSAARWTPETRASLREMAGRGTGPFLWADATAELLDMLAAAEARAARADALQARLDAVEALHRPVKDGVLVCQCCVGELGSNQEWPCETAEAMAARSEA